MKRNRSQRAAADARRALVTALSTGILSSGYKFALMFSTASDRELDDLARAARRKVRQMLLWGAREQDEEERVDQE